MLLGLFLLPLTVGCQREEVHKYTADILPTPKPPFEYEMPAEWMHGPPSSLSQLTLQTDDTDEVGNPATLTVTSLSGTAGGLLGNVNRWRGQVELPPLTEEQLKGELKNRSISGIDSQVVAIHGHKTGSGERKVNTSILGAIIPRKDDTLFIKFMGPSAVVEDSKSAFDRFLGSVKFAAGEGANDGK